MERAVVELFGHFILRDEIIGISPLYSKVINEQESYLLYGSTKLYFKVFTKQNTIEIASVYYSIKHLNEKEAMDERAKYNLWADEYKVRKEQVIKILQNE